MLNLKTNEAKMKVNNAAATVADIDTPAETETGSTHNTASPAAATSRFILSTVAMDDKRVVSPTNTPAGRVVFLQTQHATVADTGAAKDTVADSTHAAAASNLTPATATASAQIAPKHLDARYVQESGESLVPLFTVEDADLNPSSLSAATAPGDLDRSPAPSSESAAALLLASDPSESATASLLASSLAAAAAVYRPLPILRLPSPVGIKQSNSKKKKEAKGRNVSATLCSLI